MLRKTDFLLIGLAAFSGAFLFQTCYRVQSLKEEKLALERQIAADQDGIQVLRAEWSFLNDPARLEQLAATYLQALRPITATQIAGFDTLPARPTTMPASLNTTPAAPAPTAPGAHGSDKPPALGQRSAPIATLASGPMAPPVRQRPARTLRSAAAAGPAFAVAHVSTRSVPVVASGRDDIGALLTRMGRVQ